MRKLLVTLGLTCVLSSQAALVNTGIDTTAGVDNNWVAVEDVGDLGQPTYALEVINPAWLPNSASSKWISIAEDGYPLAPGDYFYALNTVVTPQSFLVRWTSDNQSTPFIYNAGGLSSVGPTLPANAFGGWSQWLYVDISQNSLFGFEVIQGEGQAGAGNPSGLRVEFAAVPEPTTLVAGALLLLPFGLSAVRRFRK
jgi:hypothetical protein